MRKGRFNILRAYDGEVLLFRATRKSSAFDGTLVDDTACRELVEEEELGWEGKTTGGVVLCDVAAGRSSMLQEPNVAAIAARMQSYIDAALAGLPAQRGRSA